MTLESNGDILAYRPSQGAVEVPANERIGFCELLPEHSSTFRLDGEEFPWVGRRCVCCPDLRNVDSGSRSANGDGDHGVFADLTGD